MGLRADLRDLFREMVGKDNVFFQPPPSVSLTYPCIVYHLDKIQPEYANNHPYKLVNNYSVTVMDFNPDSKIRDMVAQLPMCRHTGSAVVNNLYHYYFSLCY